MGKNSPTAYEHADASLQGQKTHLSASRLPDHWRPHWTWLSGLCISRGLRVLDRTGATWRELCPGHVGKWSRMPVATGADTCSFPPSFPYFSFKNLRNSCLFHALNIAFAALKQTCFSLLPDLPNLSFLIMGKTGFL